MFRILWRQMVDWMYALFRCPLASDFPFRKIQQQAAPTEYIRVRSGGGEFSCIRITNFTYYIMGKFCFDANYVPLSVPKYLCTSEILLFTASAKDLQKHEKQLISICILESWLLHSSWYENVQQDKIYWCTMLEHLATLPVLKEQSRSIWLGEVFTSDA